MSAQSVRDFFAARELAIPILELTVSTATVALAAEAHEHDQPQIEDAALQLAARAHRSEAHEGWLPLLVDKALGPQAAPLQRTLALSASWSAEAARMLAMSQGSWASWFALVGVALGNVLTRAYGFHSMERYATALHGPARDQAASAVSMRRDMAEPRSRKNARSSSS